MPIKQVLCISGSTRADSSNTRWLSAIAKHLSKQSALSFVPGPNLGDLPLFTPARLEAFQQNTQVEAFAEILSWREAVRAADALLISTPEYAHGVPSTLKSALEWLVADGAFSRKRTLVMTATPQAPRGEKCMQSLLWTLQALDVDLLAELAVYDVANKLSPNLDILDEELRELATGIGDLLLG